MNKFYKKHLGLLLLFLGVSCALNAQTTTKTATVRVDSDVTYQKITGFGGFVCSPQFGYNHMSTDEIKMLWGEESKLGYNIMRLYIPHEKRLWASSLETAKLAKSLGLIIFASPWTMPTEWKTHNSIGSIYTDEDGKEQRNYLKEEHYEDYANYLNDYVTYLRDNGVELHAISMQNEPDMPVTYHGCIWTPEQMVKFIKEYGDIIDCKLMASDGVGMTDNYANAFLADDVIDKLGIFAGHQYGAIQTGFKKLQEKGKEAWMTEFLINWNEKDATTRNFNWSIDAFSFAQAINNAMLADVNAWIHYASKRYYGMLGDGEYGTKAGVITKRGYILSHFAKYVTGTTRINSVWKDESNALQGSSYLSVTGDSVAVMVINPSNNSYDLTIDLPFYSKSGESVRTSSPSLVSLLTTAINLDEETCRPRVSVPASSVMTFVFTKSNERPVSQMTGEAVHYNKIDEQKPTKSSFGSNYKLSGKTVTFDVGNKLISTNTDAANGYLELDAEYNQLIFRVESISSKMSYTSDNTTLYYMNAKGAVKSHNYGLISFNQTENFDWVFDISRDVLVDGCTGIIGISNSNYSSVLTLKLGDVYFKMGNESMYKFGGVYSKADSDLLDCLESLSYTSLDFTQTAGITSETDWNAIAANKNCIYYIADDVMNSNTNVISGTVCDNLMLDGDNGGNFYAPVNFTATNASYSRTFDGYDMMVLPFEATIPADVKVYTLQFSTTEIKCNLLEDNKIPANTPVLIEATGTVTFEGAGDIATPKKLKNDNMIGVYIAVKAPVSSYCLKMVDGEPAFHRVTSGDESVIYSFGAYLAPGTAATVASLPLKFSDTDSVGNIEIDGDQEDEVFYDLLGRRVYRPYKGIVVDKNGKKRILR